MYFSITVFHTLKEKAVSILGFFLKAEVFSLAFNIGPTLLSEKKKFGAILAVFQLTWVWNIQK